MKYISLLLLLLSCVVQAAAQRLYVVKGFSKDYYGKVFIADTAEVFSKGWVAIYESGSDKEILKVHSDELALELHEGRMVANIVEAPYGEQSVIIYDDFNFDGKNDFAIEDGQNSCYHGPSFRYTWLQARDLGIMRLLRNWRRKTAGCFRWTQRQRASGR